MEEIRIVRASPKGVWITKASLRAMSLIFCIAIFGIAGSIAAPSVGLFVSVNFMPLAILAPSVSTKSPYQQPTRCLITKGFPVGPDRN